MSEMVVPMFAHPILRVLKKSLAAAYKDSANLKGCGTFVFKNITNVLGFQSPTVTLARGIADPTVEET